MSVNVSSKLTNSEYDKLLFQNFLCGYSTYIKALFPYFEISFLSTSLRMGVVISCYLLNFLYENTYYICAHSLKTLSICKTLNLFFQYLDLSKYFLDKA